MEDDQMFHRTMIGRIARQKELIVTDSSGTSHQGFITGLDQEWLQLTTTLDQRLVLKNLMNVTSVEETGNTLRSVDVTPEAREAIERYSKTIHMKARERDRGMRDREPLEGVANAS